MSEFARWLRAERKSREMNQKQFATLLGVENQSVSDWENDKRKPKSMALGLIAKNLGYRLEDVERMVAGKIRGRDLAREALPRMFAVPNAKLLDPIVAQHGLDHQTILDRLIDWLADQDELLQRAILKTLRPTDLSTERSVGTRITRDRQAAHSDSRQEAKHP